MVLSLVARVVFTGFGLDALSRLTLLTCPLSGLTRRVGYGGFGSMPNPPIYHIIIYCAGVEIHVLLSRVPPNMVSMSWGGFHRPP